MMSHFKTFSIEELKYHSVQPPVTIAQAFLITSTDTATAFVITHVLIQYIKLQYLQQ